MDLVVILCKYWVFVGEATFHEYERGNMGHKFSFIAWSPIHMLMLLMSWVMISIDKEETWTINLPLKVRTLWAM